ncbi:hypothetical protein OAB00_03875 [Akkermansiaceae bacterium]|nr:hypothetical protein [Akkermansiaceae bacterium]
MAIEDNNPIDNEEEIDVEEDATVTFEDPEDAVEETAEQDFYANIAEDMDERVLNQLSSDLISDYQKDKESRKDWEDGYLKGLDLLGFKYVEQNRPFRGAAGVTHPLLAEAVTQFQAQAYKELLPSEGPVKTQVLGLKTDATTEQANRVKDFMNYMIMEKMEEYTPEFDQMLFYLPLAGSTFKKVYYDAILERAVSKFVPAEDLVVPYYATDLKEAPRITHVIRQSENDLLKKMASGFYREVELMKPQTKDDTIKDKYRSLEGTKKTETDDMMYSVLELHVDLDLSDYISDNEEDSLGIKIPYIVTIEESSREVLSIYRNYVEGDAKFVRKDYFTHFKFLPGLGFYGFGLIHMIGGLSRTATAALRQLLDAGTLSNLPAGFKSRGMKVRDDDQPIQPGEFRDVDAPGGNIRDQFQLLPFKEPSQTLFNLMGFCVDAGRRFALTTDTAVGEGNQNAAVGTTIALMERGSRVMSAIHKRCYYAMRQEFKLLSKVIAEYLPPEYPYAVYGADRIIKSVDFDARVDVLPVADPNIFSMAQRVTLAQTQLQIAQTNPQLHNLHEAYTRVYEALGTKQIAELLKPEVKPFPKDPALENADALQMKIAQAFPEQDHDAHIAAHSAFLRTRMVQINPPVYALLQGHISQHVSFKAQKEVMAMMQQDQQMMMMAQQNPQQFQVMMDSEVAKRIAQITSELAQAESQQDGAKQDPLIMLKQRELDLRAMDMQRRAETDALRINNQDEQFEDRLDFDKVKLEVNDEQSDERLEVAREKMNIKNKGAKNG